jgi:hypothetical protein
MGALGVYADARGGACADVGAEDDLEAARRSAVEAVRGGDDRA